MSFNNLAPHLHVNHLLSSVSGYCSYLRLSCIFFLFLSLSSCNLNVSFLQLPHSPSYLTDLNDSLLAADDEDEEDEESRSWRR